MWFPILLFQIFLLFTRSRSKEAWISDLIVYIIELKVKNHDFELHL